jgi:hypothetical protein
MNLYRDMIDLLNSFGIGVGLGLGMVIGIRLGIKLIVLKWI